MESIPLTPGDDAITLTMLVDGKETECFITRDSSHLVYVRDPANPHGYRLVGSKTLLVNGMPATIESDVDPNSKPVINVIVPAATPSVPFQDIILIIDGKETKCYVTLDDNHMVLVSYLSGPVPARLLLLGIAEYNDGAVFSVNTTIPEETKQIARDMGYVVVN